MNTPKIDYSKLMDQLGNADIYLIDQMMKGRYQPGNKIFDAGCGHGRNIDLFLRAGFDAYGVDHDLEKIVFCQSRYPEHTARFSVQDLQRLSFENDFFHHIISSAVFHFCDSTAHFYSLFSEQVRVLKPGGTFFIRMTTLFGLPEKLAVLIGDGRYHLPDYGDRFLMTYPLIAQVIEKFPVSLLEPVKAVNVRDHRAMGVIVFQKDL